MMHVCLTETGIFTAKLGSTPLQFSSREEFLPNIPRCLNLTNSVHLCDFLRIGIPVNNTNPFKSLTEARRCFLSVTALRLCRRRETWSQVTKSFAVTCTPKAKVLSTPTRQRHMSTCDGFAPLSFKSRSSYKMKPHECSSFVRSFCAGGGT
jgi:hypothetical protein